MRVTNALPKAVGVKLIDTDIPNWQDLVAESTEPTTPPFYIEHLVQPQTPLPFELEEPFIASTVVAGQPGVEISLWEQAGGVPGKSIAENVPLPVMEGTSRISGLEQYNLPRNAALHLFFSITSEGVVSLRAFEPISMKELTVTATVALLSEEEMEQAKVLYSGLTTST